jgi:uncharacterized membrane protein YjjP (DUF1212 family)
MSREPRKFPQGLWVFLIAALAGCVIGLLYGTISALVITKSSNALGEIAGYSLGFGTGGIVTGLIAGLIVTSVNKSRASH